MAAQYQTRIYTLDSGAWTDVEAPFDCSTIIVENKDTANACAVRSDPSDSDTEKTLPAGAEGEIRASITCFAAGSRIVSLKPAAGTGPACVSFAR
jgi:hypothetical protein